MEIEKLNIYNRDYERTQGYSDFLFASLKPFREKWFQYLQTFIQSKFPEWEQSLKFEEDVFILIVSRKVSDGLCDTARIQEKMTADFSETGMCVTATEIEIYDEEDDYPDYPMNIALENNIHFIVNEVIEIFNTRETRRQEEAEEDQA